MVLFVAIVVALLLVLILSKSRPLRIVAGLLILAIVIFIVFQQYMNRQEQARSLTRVAPSQVQLLSVEPKAGYGGSYRLAGRLLNRSTQYTLSGVVVDVKVDDCPLEGNAACVTIAETTLAVNVPVPPGQARDFEEQLSFERARLTPRGRLVWHATVQSVRAR